MSSIMPLEGLRLSPGTQEGICRVSFQDTKVKETLRWDRYIRLNAAARVINDLKEEASTVLDVGGFDGALALFVPDTHVEVIDPVTTGGDFMKMEIPDQFYDIVCAIDVLEHVEPSLREDFLAKLSRVSKNLVLINYPSLQSLDAQKAVLVACDNQFIKEHVAWKLPETGWVMGFMSAHGFYCESADYGNIALWAGQFVASQLGYEKADELNKYLIEQHLDEPFTKPLYKMVVCKRE